MAFVRPDMKNFVSFGFSFLCAHLGESEFQIGDVRRPITTWLSLSDSRHNNSIWGELMFSLSYLPTAERLTVVVVKARNLKLSEAQQVSLQNVFVKVSVDEAPTKKSIQNERTQSRIQFQWHFFSSRSFFFLSFVFTFYCASAGVSTEG